DHVGPIARTVEDAALLLNGLAGHDPNDPSSALTAAPIYNARLRRGVRGWRIGVYNAETLAGCGAESLRAFDEAIAVYRRLGADLRDVDLPVDGSVAHACQRVIRIGEAAAYHRAYLRAGMDYGKESAVRRQLAAGSLISAAIYQRALQLRASLIDRMQATFTEFDVLVTPGWDAIPDERGFPSAPILSGIWNLCGFPCIVVPAGMRSAPPVLPLGIQIVGSPFEEEKVLVAANAFEQAADWHRMRPPDPSR